MPVTVLPRRWREALVALVASAQQELLIAAPFMTKDGTTTVTDHMSRTMRETGRVNVVTDLSPSHVMDGSLDATAVLEIAETHARCAIWHVPRLHAKVYVADARRAIVTSANLTASAFFRNVECGLDISDATVVSSVRRDMSDMETIGTPVPIDAMRRYVDAARKVQETFKRQASSVDRRLCRAFEDAVGEASDALVRLRLASGAMHTVFARTITLLLIRHGSLTTEALHPLVRQLHPDLCDDSVDRVIDGKRFGKKWKHAVRTAQQQLKKKGIVRLQGDTWSATPDASRFLDSQS